MIHIQITPAHSVFDTITIDNDELIKSINTMPDNEYSQIVSGILNKESLTVDRIMTVIAFSWKILNKKKLNPAQRNAINAFIEELKPIQV